MLNIEPMRPKHLSQLTTLSVEDDQIKYVGTMEEILVNISDVVHPHIIVSENKVVGFFLIDTQYSSHYSFCTTPSLGFRAYFIDKQYQGKGLGTQTMRLLKPYLSEHYPRFERIYLTVNCKNLTAYHCYLNSGFQDIKELYYGGSAGPQHIMLMRY